MFTLLLTTAIVLVTVAAFNLDVRNPVLVPGKTIDSYFGYAIAIHKYSGQKWLLVGAPTESRMGRAYKCRIFKASLKVQFLCESLLVSEEGPRWVDNRIGSWMGATVASSRGNALVCAPLFGQELGLCKVSQDNLNSFVPYLGSRNYGIGFSAIFSADGEQIYTGSSNGKFATIGLLLTDLSTGQTSKYYSGANRHYPAYALANGNIFRGNEGVAMSIGLHVKTFCAGTVLLLQNSPDYEFDSAFSHWGSLDALIGEQPGELFGASLSISDINGDGLDDIIVGAPHHTDFADHEIKFEIGAVYIYHQRNWHFSRKSDEILLGKHEGGRFGHAVAALGDINGDGFNDVAVGAPYEGFGVVYIHHGSKSGLSSKADQKICGDQFKPPLMSFGASFGVGDVDADDNRYNDVIIGAYESDTVVYLPARPVVNVDVKVQFIPELINLDNRTCDTDAVNGQPVTSAACAAIVYCLSYGGKSVSDVISVNVTIHLDVKQPQRPRLRFLSSDQRTKSVSSVNMMLKARVPSCQKKMTYVVDDISDKISPMEAEISVIMSEELWTASPLQNPLSARKISKSLSINKNCRNNLVCVPDLQLSVTKNLDKLMQGSNERLIVDVSIHNAGEDAFASYFQLHMASMLSFINTERNGSDFSVQCSPPEDDILRCSIGNPMPADSTVKLRIFLQPVPDVTSNNRDVHFQLDAFSVNKEEPSKSLDNRRNVSLSFYVETDLFVDGRSGVSDINVTITDPASGSPVLKNRTDWPEFVHFYEIRSTGPSDILGVDVVILFQTTTSMGHQLSQLTGQPTVTQGEASCDSLVLENVPLNDPNTVDVNRTSPEKKLHYPVDEKNTVIRCRTNRLTRSDRVVIRLSARVSAEAVVNGSENRLVIASKMMATVTSLPFGLDHSIIEEKSATATTTVYKFVEVNPTTLIMARWWIPAASAGGAIIILAIIAAILYKLGFFKRLRPDTKPLTEAQEDDNNAEPEGQS